MKMHMKKHTLFFTTVLVTLLLAGCQKENPESAIPSEVEPVENEVVIPARLEGVTPGTRVETDGMTGISVWSDNDPIGLYVDGTGFSRYKVASVVDGSVRLSLSGDQARTHFAVYPYASAVDASHSAEDIQVKYPTSYGVGLYSAARLETWSPAPMVSLNTTTELTFYHVGALLRIRVTDVPTGTTSLAFKFVGMDNVTGNYTVSNPGTALATTSLAEGTGTGNTVTFTEIQRQEDMTFNIPLPTQDYSGLTSIEVTAKGSTTITTRKSLSGWGQLGHGQGKQMSIDFTTVSYPAGALADGRFGDYYISPGILKWDDSLNGGAGGYTLTDGEDPLEVLKYGRATAETTPSMDDVKDVYFHRRFSKTGNTKTLKYRFDGQNTHNPGIQNRFITVKGQAWLIPNGTEWLNITTSRPNDLKATVNDSKRWSYCMTALDLTGTEYVERWGDSVQGVILFPNNALISCPGLVDSHEPHITGSRMITPRSLRILLDGGCAFFPAAGYYNSTTWSGAHVYCAASNDSGNPNYYHVIANYTLDNRFIDEFLYCPARLIHD